MDTRTYGITMTPLQPLQKDIYPLFPNAWRWVLLPGRLETSPLLWSASHYDPNTARKTIYPPSPLYITRRSDFVKGSPEEGRSSFGFEGEQRPYPGLWPGGVGQFWVYLRARCPFPDGRKLAHPSSPI